MIGVGEAINLAKELKLDLTKLFEVTSTSSASCWAINSYFPVAGIGPESPADNNFTQGFSTDLMKKDLSLAIKANKNNKVNLDFLKKAQTKYKDISEKGEGKKDFSSVVKNL